MINKLIMLLFATLESMIRNISGGLGYRIRYIYYKARLKQCGRNVRIDIGVLIENPGSVTIGNDVWISPYCVITARPVGLVISNRIEKKITNPDFNGVIGDVVIGSEVGIGIRNIIHGYGGVLIGDRVTTAAGVSLYSFSHFPYDENDRGKVTFANSMVRSNDISCIEHPVVVGDGAYIALGASFLEVPLGEMLSYIRILWC